MKLNEIYDPNDANKKGHVVFLLEDLQIPQRCASCGRYVDMMRVSSRSHIPE